MNNISFHATVATVTSAEDSIFSLFVRGGKNVTHLIFAVAIWLFSSFISIIRSTWRKTCSLYGTVDNHSDVVTTIMICGLLVGGLMYRGATKSLKTDVKVADQKFIYAEMISTLSTLIFFLLYLPLTLYHHDLFSLCGLLMVIIIIGWTMNQKDEKLFPQSWTDIRPIRDEGWKWEEEEETVSVSFTVENQSPSPNHDVTEKEKGKETEGLYWFAGAYPWEREWERKNAGCICGRG